MRMAHVLTFYDPLGMCWFSNPFWATRLYRRKCVWGTGQDNLCGYKGSSKCGWCSTVCWVDYWRSFYKEVYFCVKYTSSTKKYISNAAEAELLKSPKTQTTPVTIFSVYCHLAGATGAWWQRQRDWGRASSLRPSGSLTQTQFHKLSQDALLSVKK